MPSGHIPGDAAALALLIDLLHVGDWVGLAPIEIGYLWVLGGGGVDDPGPRGLREPEEAPFL